jgi:SAM-dependent methyltransferase
MSFKDHFSRQACDYSRYRPHYPRALFAYLAAQVEQHRCAWDCGTGSGQAALALAEFFAEVIATDASARQIAHAVPQPRISYRVAPAECSALEPGSVDLITVAQALHWFDLERFYAEVRRVRRPGGVLAVWCYGLNRVTPAVDRVVKRFYSDVVGPFWPPERQQVEAAYRELPFPFTEWQAPRFETQTCWNLEHFLGYLGTWSAVQHYQQQRGHDPREWLQDELARAWGDPGIRRRVHWPIHVRVGR